MLTNYNWRSGSYPNLISRIRYNMYVTYTDCTFVAGNRMEDMIFEKIEKRRPNRLSNLEYLGLDMVQAGNNYGPGTPYG